MVEPTLTKRESARGAQHVLDSALASLASPSVFSSVVQGGLLIFTKILLICYSGLSMPIIKSAKKRVKVAAKARSRNLHTKRQVRETLKAFAVALESGKPAEVAKTQNAAIRALDIAAKKNVIHKNKAARFKSNLAKQLKSAGIKPSKATAKKVVAKKTSTKKTAGAKSAK